MFLDREQRSRAYYQCVSKRHIRDIHHLRPRIPGDPKVTKPITKSTKILAADDLLADRKLIEHMQMVSLEFLKVMHPNNREGYRQGFHRPPVNSQFHLHMHLMIEPIKPQPRRPGRYVYGKGLISVDMVF